MEIFEPADEVVARVRQVVADAAAPAIREGRAEITVCRLAELAEGTVYDCPAVLLEPLRREAAQIVVEVQQEDLWWVDVADGPGTELHGWIGRDRYALLGSLVRAVVAGGYRHGPCIREVKRLLRSPRQLKGWSETFEIEDEPFTSQHFGSEGGPAQERRFSPY